MNTLFKLKLDEPTHGFFPDLEIEVSKATVAVFTKDTILGLNHNLKK